MPLKSFQHATGAVTLSFCPVQGPHGAGPTILASATLAGVFDVNFSTNSQLELLSLDFSKPGEAPDVIGVVQAPERFHRLAWSQRVQTDASFPPMGLLAGGLADGSICLWDPAVIGSRPEGRPALLARMQKHTGAVKGLEFNPFTHNLLASGAADADLCIWDLQNPTKPQLFPALKGTPQAAGSEVQHLQWNRKVEYILASCYSTGSTAVWDLRKQKQVISFRDPSSQHRVSVLQWNPENATQLVVASDDDRSPTLQMWDLRNSQSPLKEFVGHSKGVLGMAWNMHDPTLLLSCGKDNRNICWDVNTTDIMCELPAGHNYNFDIQWAPNNRGVFATACMDGLVGVHNLMTCTGGKVVQTFNDDFTTSQTVSGESTPLKRVPAWMKRPCGATFGFGGKLVKFTNQKVGATDASGQAVQRDAGAITISQVITEHDLIQRSEQFEAAISGGDQSALQRYCAHKASALQAAAPEEAETWSFLALLFEGTDGRRELLKKLGFEDVLARQVSSQGVDANGNALAAEMDALSMGPDGGSGGGAANGVGGGHDMGSQEDDPDFFDKLPDEGIQAVSSPVKSPTAPQKGLGLDAHVDGHRVLGGSDAGPDASHELEEDVMRAMIAGNYESAVETCFKAHRLADALLISNIFNSDLFKRTMHRYMKLCPKPYMNIIKATVDGDYEGIVRTRPVGQWRETLALLATYSSTDTWTKQCDVLASRLAAAGMHHAALLCYICAGNIDSAVAHWARTVGNTKQVDQLQNVMEKSVIMGLGTGSSKQSGALSDLVTSYASLLAAQGRLGTALDYLDYVPGEASTTVAVLRDRIYRSGAVTTQWDKRGPPPFPFVMEDVKASYIPQQQTQMAAKQAAGMQMSNQYPAYNNTYQQQAQPQAQQATAYGGQQYAAQQATYAPAGPQTTAMSRQNPYPAQTPSYATNAYGGYPQQQQPVQQPPASMYQAAGQAGGYNYQQAASTSPYAQQPQQHSTGFGASATPQYQQQAAAPTPMFTPTTTNASAQLASKMQQPQPQAVQQPVAPPPQTSTMQPGFGGLQASGSGGYGSQPQYQQQDPLAGQVYAPKRPSVTAVPPASTPAQNVYTAAQTHAAAAPAPGPMSTGPGYGSTTPHAAAQPTPQANYFVPTTTTAAAAVPAQTMYAGAGTLPGLASGGSGMMGVAAPAAAARPAAPPPPAGPPANISIASADTSKVPADQQGIINSLTNLYNSCMPLAVNPAKKREMEDNTKKIGQLFWRMANKEVSDSVLPKLQELCKAIDAADWHTANHLQVQMTTTDWEECGYWLSAVKRLIKMRQMASH